MAAGAALVLSAGGFVTTLERSSLRCNNRSPLISGLLACGARTMRGVVRTGEQPLIDKLPAWLMNVATG